MKTLMIRSVLLALICLLVGFEGTACAEIKIDNHADGSTVRYPVILLRGQVSQSAEDLWVGIGQTAAPLTRHKTRFKALVRLAPGENVVRVSTQTPAQRVS